MNIVIDARGLNLLNIAPGVSRERIRAALEAIAEDAASYIAEAAPVGVFGKLQSAFTEGASIAETRDTISAQFDTAKTAPYAWYVIHGTAPMKWNPGRHLVPWVEKKLGLADREAVSVAYAIGRGFMKHGMKGNDFITPVIRANRKAWKKLIVDALEKLNH